MIMHITFAVNLNKVISRLASLKYVTPFHLETFNNNPHHLFHSFRSGFLFSSVVYIRYPMKRFLCVKCK